jgi:DNA-binding NarL/FixJ family response regulator
VPPLRVAILAGRESGRRLSEALKRSVDPVEVVGDPSGPDVDVVVVAAGARGEVRDARQRHPDLTLIAVVDDADRFSLRGALAEGADGIVVDGRLDDTLMATIESARLGQVTVPRELRGALVRPTLSTREKQVLGMVVLGFSNGEIARKLVLTESTIKSHLSSSFTKLGVRSRSEAAALILDEDAGLGTGILAISGAEGANGG